jgi:XTP/dITP diphosphohydrolase
MELVFASRNFNKLREIAHQLPDGIRLLGLEDIGCHDEIPETAETIEGNAALKANFVSSRFGFDCFADDSGLEVEAIGGAPGVNSARFAGKQKHDGDNNAKLLDALQGQANRNAQFKTVITLNIKGRQHQFTGIVRGKILEKPAGNGGFGYDPLFVPEGHQRSFAQMTLDEKAAISHRGKAVSALLSFLQGSDAENRSDSGR